MSDLFGSTPVPRWLSTDERQIMHQEEGRRIGEAFSQSFDSAFNMANQRAYAEKREKQAWEEIQPAVDALRGITSLDDAMKKVGEHPEWLLNPKTAPIMNQTLNTFASAERIQNNSVQGQVAKKSADQFAKMVQGLADRGGEAAIVAGKYAGALGQVPTPQTWQAFGEDLGKLGIKQDELVDKANLPVQSITQGPKGPVVKYGELQSDLEKQKEANRVALESVRQVNREKLAKLRQGYESKLGKAMGDVERAREDPNMKPEDVQRLEKSVNAIEAEMNLFTAEPEVRNYGGFTFVQWGKDRWRIDDLTSSEKVEAGVIAAKIKDLQGREQTTETKTELLNAKTELQNLRQRAAKSRRITGQQPAVAPAPAPKQSDLYQEFESLFGPTK